MKLTSLKGSECLPKYPQYHQGSFHDQDAHCECNLCTLNDGIGQAVSQLEQVELCVDEEKLTDAIWGNDFFTHKSMDVAQCRKLAKSLSQSIKQWAYLEVKK